MFCGRVVCSTSTTTSCSKMSSQSNKSTLGNFCWSAYWQVRRLYIQQQRFLWWSAEDHKAKWELIAERSRHKQALLRLQWHFWSLFMNCGFNHKLFHWACIENFVFIHWRSLYKAGLWTIIFVPFGLTLESQLNAWARAGKQKNYLCFCFFALLFGHIINIL